MTELQRLLRYNDINMDTNMTITYYVEKNAGLRLFYLLPAAIMYSLVKACSVSVSKICDEPLKLSESNYWIHIHKSLTFGGKLKSRWLPQLINFSKQQTKNLMNNLNKTLKVIFGCTSITH